MSEPIRISARPTAEEIVKQRAWRRPSRKHQFAEVIVGFLAAAFFLGAIYLILAYWRQ